MKSLYAALLALLCGCSSLRESAHGATALDAASTAIGIGSGAAVEVNPLIGSPAAFAGIMLARVIGVEIADGMDEPARTQTLAGLNSIWWGAGVSNVLIILAASSPVGWAFGAMAGLGWWASTENQRLFAQACAQERERLGNAKLVCIYRQPGHRLNLLAILTTDPPPMRRPPCHIATRTTTMAEPSIPRVGLE